MPGSDYVCESFTKPAINHSEPQAPCTIAVALGANIPSKAGPPHQTLPEVRPILERTIELWLTKALSGNEKIYANCALRFRWSPIFETKAFGGPVNQPNFLNSVLVADGPRLSAVRPSEEEAIKLLNNFLSIEQEFGRNRESSELRWGPRQLDLDLLAWGDLQIQNKSLTLPHPRLIERDFVVIPLGAALNQGQAPIKKIPPQKNWPENNQ